MEKEKEEKEKEMKKKKKKKRKRKEKEKKKKRKRMKIATLCLETRARSEEGLMARAFKAWYPKPLLVGSRRLCVRYMGGWVEYSKL